MSVYFDKTHRVKKIDGWWVPQWKRGFLRWDRYKLMVADTSIGGMEMYSESWLDVKPLLCKTILAYIKCLAFSNTISYI